MALTIIKPDTLRTHIVYFIDGLWTPIGPVKRLAVRSVRPGTEMTVTV